LEAENKLREILGTRVTIRTASKGGKIEVEFYSKEELERILDLMDKI